MKRALGILLVFIAVITAGCEFEAPLTEKQGLPLDARLLGTWANVTDETKKNSFEISKYSETEYLFRDHNGESMTGYPGKLGNTSFIQLIVPDKSGVKKYFVISYVFLGNDLQISILDTSAGDKSKALVEIRRSLLQNRISGGRFVEAGRFKMVNTASTPVKKPPATDQALSSMLLSAAEKGDVTAVNNAIARGANINVKDSNGVTALMKAAGSGHTAVVKGLLEKGADVDIENADGKTALDFADDKSHDDIVGILIKAFGQKQIDATNKAIDRITKEINDIEEINKLRIAQINDNDKDIGLLAKNIDEINLLIASGDGEIATVKALLAKGVNVNVASKAGTTPLMFAAQDGHTPVVQILIAKGAVLNTKNNDGSTALKLSAFSGSLSVVQFLLAKGADVNSKNNKGFTPLISAAQEGHTAVVQALLAKGAEINTKNNLGGTALMYAAQDGRAPVVQILLAKGADVYAETMNGLTALDFASIKPHSDIVQILKAKTKPQ